jgi:hypothetical protein
MAQDKQQVRLLRFEQDGRFGFKDDKGAIVIQPVYDDARDFACGLAPVNRGAILDYRLRPPKRAGGKWGYVNTRGETVVPLTLAWACEFSDGLAQVSDEEGLRFIDPEGRTVTTLGKVSSAGNFSEGLAPVYVDRSLQKHDWQTRFIDKTGKAIFAVDGYADEFHEGYAILSVRDAADAANRKYGFIDLTGKVVIAPRFAEALRFSEGLAPVRTMKTIVPGTGDAWGYIDKSGEYVLRPGFNEAHNFRNGLATVHVGGALRENEQHSPSTWQGGEWELIDRRGNVLERSKERIESEEPPNPNTRDGGDGR